MDYVNYCEEPLFFMKIYNCLSEDKSFEFERKFQEFKKLFYEKYDNKLFNPRISFKDGFIYITQDELMSICVDIREELNTKVIVDEDLLEDVLHEFNTSHGLCVADPNDMIQNNESYKYIIDYDEICEEIEKILY